MSEWYGANPDLTRPVVVVHLATIDPVPMLLCRPTLYRVVPVEAFPGTPRVSCPLCMRIAERLAIPQTADDVCHDGPPPEPPPPDQSWIQMTSIKDDPPPPALSPTAPTIAVNLAGAPSRDDARLLAEGALRRRRAGAAHTRHHEFPV